MHKRYLALDGVRGYASFGVLVYHAILVYDSSLIKRALNISFQSIDGIYEKLIKVVFSIFYGPMAVTLFFVLSGIVLSIALRKSVIHHPILFNLEFLLKRVARIYPTLIVSIVLFWASRVLLHQIAPGIFSKYGLRDMIENVTLINAAINGATWTLQVEIMAIPFILFCFFIHKKFGIRGLLILLFVTLISAENKSMQFSGIPSIFYENISPFVCGFIIASDEAEQFFILITKDARFFVAILCGLFVVPLITRPTSMSSVIVQLFCASIFLGGIYYRQFPPILKFLESRPSVYFGKISYSFYLNNVIFLYIFHPIFLTYFSAKEHPLEFGLLTTVICTILAVILSHITEKYVEQPSIQLGKKITNLLSSIETRYLMRPTLETGTSMNIDSPSIAIAEDEIRKE